MRNRGLDHLLVVSIALFVTVAGFAVAKVSPRLLLGIRGLDLSKAAVSCSSTALSAIGARTIVSGSTFQTQVGCVQEGQAIYLDDASYIFSQVPSSLASRPIAYIKTPNTEIMNDVDMSWRVQITRASEVYVFYRKIPGQNIQPPTWITSSYDKITPDSFSNLSPFLVRENTNNPPLKGLYDVYKYRNTSVTGALTFGKAIPENSSSAYSMYIIGVVPVPTTPTNSPTVRPTSITTTRPSATPIRTSTPAPTTPTTTLPPVSGDFPCGKFPNANPGCMNVSFQSWFDNVPASSQTLSVNYTPRLLHQHYDCAVPQARANGQYLRQGMKIVCQFTRYNSIVPSLSSNSGWFDSCNQGNCFEKFNLSLPPCQGGKYEGKECKSENVHTVRSSDMSSSTEMRYRINANFVGLDGGRHFLSTNWQTAIGYRSSSEFTARYWIAQCGNYQRMILPTVDKYMKGNEPIPTVRGTISLPFESNGGCGSQFKTFVFLDPSQHVRVEGAQTGTTLFETNGHYKGNLTWDTTKTTNGIHSVLFINMEGKSSYVSASGIAFRFNVQN
jgi:hypothetical protein